MRLLIIGGTRFLGRHIAEQALQRGHQLTLLHRGRSGPALFPQAEHRIADRDGDLSALAQGEWDAAIDTSAYVPRQVRALAAAVAPRVAHYQLVSSISVYSAFDKPGMDESGATATLADHTVETVTGETYGGLKALCEQAADLTGPAQPLTMGGSLDTALSALNPAARLQWVDEQFLLDQGVAPWSDLPVWLPTAQAGLHTVNISRALATGLNCRPLRDTLLDTAAWADQQAAATPAATAAPGPARPAVGLSSEREAALLDGTPKA